MDAVTHPPIPVNEPVLDYAPGSPERANLVEALRAVTFDCETAAKRIILVSKLSSPTAMRGCGASVTERVSSMAKGITLAPSPFASIRRILPPDQNTLARLSGVQAMLG